MRAERRQHAKSEEKENYRAKAEIMPPKASNFLTFWHDKVGNCACSEFLHEGERERRTGHSIFVFSRRNPELIDWHTLDLLSHYEKQRNPLSQAQVALSTEVITNTVTKRIPKQTFTLTYWKKNCGDVRLGRSLRFEQFTWTSNS